MMNALVEDYFRYDELAQMEAEAIRHNITGSDTEVLEHRELDEVPRPRELISNVEIGEKENQSPDQTDNQQVIQRFRIYSDAETDAFLKENKNTGQKTKSDMKIVTDFFRSVGEFRDPATIPSSELESLLARFFLGVRKRDSI